MPFLFLCRRCPGGGPGWGVDGSPDSPGRNCFPQGNILIIQESDKPEPDDNLGGGVICFLFKRKVKLFSIGLMDIARTRGDFLEVEDFSSNRPFRIDFEGLGDNAVQTIPIERNNVVRLCLNLLGEGGVTQISFCSDDQSDSPVESPSDAPTVALSASPTTRSPTFSPPTPTLGSISGNVMEDMDNDNTGDIDLAGVLITLLDRSGVVVGTTLTDTGGAYVFYNLVFGNYTVLETNLAGYADVSDVDGANDNRVFVRLAASTNSTGNNFVDELASIAPSFAPSSSGAPSGSISPSATPSTSVGPSSSQLPFCKSVVKIDFDRFSNNSLIDPGTYVSSEWRDSFGVTISAWASCGGFTPDGKARLFDSSAPGTDDGNSALGSPNRFCSVGGPGTGAGGSPGMPGENCIAQGNILVIQESNKTAPDDNFAGGVLCFEFVIPTGIQSVGLMDIPEGRGDFLEVEVEGVDAPTRINFVGLGNNAVQDVPVNVIAARRLCVYLLGEGAMTELVICSNGIDSPSSVPSATPSASPSGTPSTRPTFSALPSSQPSSIPTGSSSPSERPSALPSVSSGPSSIRQDLSTSSGPKSVLPSLSNDGCKEVSVEFDAAGSDRFKMYGLSMFANMTANVNSQGSSAVPPSSVEGGAQTFLFATPVQRTISIGLLDIDNNNSYIEVESVDSVDPIKVDITGTGNGTVQTVLLPFTGVSRVSVHFSGSGNVTECKFCIVGDFEANSRTGVQGVPRLPSDVLSKCQSRDFPCDSDSSKVRTCRYDYGEEKWVNSCIDESEWKEAKEVWTAYCGRCQDLPQNPADFSPTSKAKLKEMDGMCSTGKFGVDNIAVLRSDGETVDFTLKHNFISKLERTQIWFDNPGPNGGSLCSEEEDIASNTEIGRYTALCSAGWATLDVVAESGNSFKMLGVIEDVPAPLCQDGFDFIDFNPMKRCHWQIKIPCDYSMSTRHLASRAIVEELPGLTKESLEELAKVGSDCELRSKAVDVLPVAVDSCTQRGFEQPVKLISQNEDTVTFSISQVWKGCSSASNGRLLSWIAADYIGLDDHLQCAKFDSLSCGLVTTLSAKCSDGATVIDLYTYDTDPSLFRQADGSAVIVPAACGTSGDARTMCHFRYILKCDPSQCAKSRPAVRRLGSTLKSYA